MHRCSCLIATCAHVPIQPHLIHIHIKSDELSREREKNIYLGATFINVSYRKLQQCSLQVPRKKGEQRLRQFCL